MNEPGAKLDPNVIRLTIRRALRTIVQNKRIEPNDADVRFLIGALCQGVRQNEKENIWLGLVGGLEDIERERALEAE